MKHLTAKGLAFNSPTGRHLVRGLQMSTEREHVAVVRRNGVGKSTLLEVLVGEVPPSEGRVERFFVVAESGCRLVTGGFEALLRTLEAERDEANNKYTAELAQLVRKEEHNATLRWRRARKRVGGRTRELDRCPAREDCPGTEEDFSKSTLQHRFRHQCGSAEVLLPYASIPADSGAWMLWA